MLAFERALVLAKRAGGPRGGQGRSASAAATDAAQDTIAAARAGLGAAMMSVCVFLKRASWRSAPSKCRRRPTAGEKFSIVDCCVVAILAGVRRPHGDVCLQAGAPLRSAARRSRGHRRLRLRMTAATRTLLARASRATCGRRNNTGARMATRTRADSALRRRRASGTSMTWASRSKLPGAHAPAEPRRPAAPD